MIVMHQDDTTRHTSSTSPAPAWGHVALISGVFSVLVIVVTVTRDALSRVGGSSIQS